MEHTDHSGFATKYCCITLSRIAHTFREQLFPLLRHENIMLLNRLIIKVREFTS